MRGRLWMGLALLLGWQTLVAQTGFDPQVPPWLVEQGARFQLQDHHGRAVSAADYRGDYLLIYFGYSACPDICPTALQTMRMALEGVGEAARQVQPLFISVDSKRDTPAVLAEFVRFFHPRLIGLTGSKQQLFNAAKHFGLRYHTGRVEGRYEVSHSDNLYLFGPAGALLAFFPHGTTQAELQAGLAQHLE